MNLGELPTHTLYTVEPTDGLDRAIALMEAHDIHHLPVVRDQTIVGIVSDRDLLLSVGWKRRFERRLDHDTDALAGPVCVEEVMSSPAVTLRRNHDLSDAAGVMVERMISAVPIAEGGRLVSLVTRLDLLHLALEIPPGQHVHDRLQVEVGRHMQTSVVSVGPSDSLEDVVSLMHRGHLRHVPVVAGGLVIGIISDRDVRRAFGVQRIEDQQAQAAGDLYIVPCRAATAMTNEVRTVRPRATMATATRIMAEHRIGSLPVERDCRLMGIVTDTDVLRVLSHKEP